MLRWFCVAAAWDGPIQGLNVACAPCAGSEVVYTITAGNTGSVRLKNVSVQVPPWAQLLNCTPPVQGTIPTYGSMVCYAGYTFSQDFYEAGVLSFTASAKPNELPAFVQSQAATVTPTYTPQLTFHPGNCTLPPAARE